MFLCVKINDNQRVNYNKVKLQFTSSKISIPYSIGKHDFRLKKGIKNQLQIDNQCL
jgi:hypothetical protein